MKVWVRFIFYLLWFNLTKRTNFPFKGALKFTDVKKKKNVIKSLKNFRSKVLKRGSNRQRTVHSFLIQLWQKTH